MIGSIEDVQWDYEKEEKEQDGDHWPRKVWIQKRTLK